MSRFIVSDSPLPGLKVITRQRIGDTRGFLSRLFCAEELSAAGWIGPVAQVNHTRTSKRGTIRGMHFQQAPNAEMKLVNCIRGEVWDVAVDLRANSPTFLHWHAECISLDNGRAMLIPEGFSHGFQALTDDVELLYLHSAGYSPGAEGGLNPLDPHLGIEWPLSVSELSLKDEAHPLIDTGFEGVHL